MDFQKAVFDKMRFGVRQKFSNSLIHSVRTRTVEDLMSDSLVAEIQYFVMGCVRKEILDTISIPDGWWQAFKAEVLKRILPADAPLNIRYRQVNTRVNHYRLCPHSISEKDTVHFAYLADIAAGRFGI